MGSGGGGDNGMQMMMMILMQQQMEQQRREQERQMEEQAFGAAQRAEGQNYQRYQDLITTQNKKVGDQWDMYNQNIGKIKKINPGYNANKEYAFNPYTVNANYQRSRNRQEADANTDLLNQWYGGLDKQALDDYNMAKKQYEASKNWLAEAQAAQDAGDRILGDAPAGAWGAGGEMVSGGAGADAEENPNAVANAVGDTSGMADVFKNFAAGAPTGATPSSGMVGLSGGAGGSGFLSDEGGNDNLAGVFGKAIGLGSPNQQRASGQSIF